MVNRYLCLKPDDGSNTVWRIVKADDIMTGVSFVCNPLTSWMEVQHHNIDCHLGTGYWCSDFFSLIAEKWREFKEINK